MNQFFGGPTLSVRGARRQSIHWALGPGHQAMAVLVGPTQSVDVAAGIIAVASRSLSA